MYDLAASAVLLVAFAAVFVLLWALGRVGGKIAVERARAGLMSAADIFGLAASLAVFAYLVYALFRGERF